MSRIENQKRTVTLMIRLYCRHKEGNEVLCNSCEELIVYAHARLERCPYGEKKGSCSHCRTHCYRPQMRDQVRRVMRFSGPRMILYAPVEAIRHFFGKFFC